MKPVAELKKELVFNREMNELIDILKKVATAQFQAVFSRWKKLDNEQRFVNLIPPFFGPLNLKALRHPLFVNPVNNVLSIIITSDAGFLGGLNSSIIENAFGQRRRKEKVQYTVVGEKGREHVENQGTSSTMPTPQAEAKETETPADRKTPDSFEAAVSYEPFLDVDVLGEKGRDYMDGADSTKTSFDFVPGVSDQVDPAEAQRLSHHVFRMCLRHKIGKVIVTYPKFISFSQQEVETLDLLEWLKNPPAVSSPHDTISELPLEFSYEPFLDKVADYLLRLWLTHKIYEIYWHSKLSEFAARMMHLESSLQELSDMKNKLNLQYFKSKHEITDRTIRDIFGGLLTTKRKSKELETSNSQLMQYA